jgi:hypothetical protein
LGRDTPVTADLGQLDGHDVFIGDLQLAFGCRSGGMGSVMRDDSPICGFLERLVQDPIVETIAGKEPGSLKMLMRIGGLRKLQDRFFINLEIRFDGCSER